MATTRINLKNNRLSAEVLLRPGSDTRRALLARANLAGVHYRRLAREELHDASSPFADKDQLSVADPAAFHASVSPDGSEIIISVDAPAAARVEEGNQRAGRNFIHPRRRGKRLALELKPGREAEFDGAFIAKVGGKRFLMLRRVRTVPGHHLLRRAIQIAFR